LNAYRKRKKGRGNYLSKVLEKLIDSARKGEEQGIKIKKWSLNGGKIKLSSRKGEKKTQKFCERICARRQGKGEETKFEVRKEEDNEEIPVPRGRVCRTREEEKKKASKSQGS